MRTPLVSATLAVSLATTLAPDAAAAERYLLQSTFGLQVPAVGQSPVRWAESVRALTGGAVDIEVYGAGDFVPALEVFGAVASGALPMGFDWVGYQADRIPVSNLIGAMPFGPDPDTFLGWMFEGGGLEILQRAYEPHGVHVIPCHLVIGEGGGWFNRPIEAVADLQGLNMRMSGLGARALARLGANTQLIPAGELYVSLERGRIDATEFSAPQVDVGLGFQQIADYYYMPGWHQPASWNSVIVNAAVWEAIAPEDREAMVAACHANITRHLALQIDAQPDALDEIEAAGVEIRRFPDPVLDALREASAAVLDEAAAADPLFAEARESLATYVARADRWRALQDLSR